MPNLQNVIFDLDGTLIDSYPGIEGAYRKAINTLLPGREVPAIQHLIGPPINLIFQRSLNLDDETLLADLVRVFKTSYDTETWLNTTVYPGVPELLQTLAGQTRRLFLVTNKRRFPTLQILEHFKLLPYFEQVVNPDLVDPPFRKKGEALKYLMDTQGLNAKATIFVGDSQEDADAALANKTWFAGADYGYGRPEGEFRETGKVHLKAPLELLNHL